MISGDMGGGALACSGMEEPIKRKNKMIEGSREEEGGGGRVLVGKPDTHNAPLS